MRSTGVKSLLENNDLISAASLFKIRSLAWSSVSGTENEKDQISEKENQQRPKLRD